LLNKKRTILLFLAGGMACFICAAVMVRHFSGKFTDSGPTVIAGPMPVAQEKGDATVDHIDEQKVAKWMVYVTGAVRSPGVYEIQEGARVYQAVDKAGGFIAQADRVAVNLAMKMSDGMHVHIPSEGEMRSPNVGSANFVQEPAESSPGLGAVPGGAEKQRIDINRADSAALQSLKGIGPKTANAIISYREQYGAFRSVEELLRVKGIGPKKLDAIKDCIVCNH